MPTAEFLREYETAILLSLKKEGFLTQTQFERCKAKLENLSGKKNKLPFEEDAI